MLPDRDDWRLWTTEASLVVTSPKALTEARAIVDAVTSEVEEACSRFRPDSELTRKRESLVDGAEVSDLLALLVSSALQAAEWTDGDVDPTLGGDLVALGYVGDLPVFPTDTGTGDPGSAAREPISVQTLERRSPWRDVVVDGTRLVVPDGVTLDLGATAKAVAADLSASRVAAALDTGVLVSLGGDIATQGPGPEEGWQILVQDLDVDPSQRVSLSGGAALATSSTQKRRWLNASGAHHHILDPRSGLSADPVWKTVTVSADTCLRANALSTASIVRGFRAVSWLEAQGVSARFVDRAGRIVTTGSWPADDEKESTDD